MNKNIKKILSNKKKKCVRKENKYRILNDKHFKMGNFVNQRKQKRNTNEKKILLRDSNHRPRSCRYYESVNTTTTPLRCFWASNKIIILVCITCSSFELAIHIHEHERTSLGHFNAYLTCIKWSAVIFPSLSSEGAIQSGCHSVCF